MECLTHETIHLALDLALDNALRRHKFAEHVEGYLRYANKPEWLAKDALAYVRRNAHQQLQAVLSETISYDGVVDNIDYFLKLQ